jgi:hypothetical protein
VCREVYDRVYDRWPYYQEGQTYLHIGHLEPLERSNFVYVLGSSGMMQRVLILQKNVCKKLTHVHKVVTLGGVSTFAKVKKLVVGIS